MESAHMAEGLYIGLVMLCKCYKIARENMQSRTLNAEQLVFTANITAIALRGNTPEKLKDSTLSTKEVGDDLLILAK